MSICWLRYQVPALLETCPFCLSSTSVVIADTWDNLLPCKGLDTRLSGCGDITVYCVVEICGGTKLVSVCLYSGLVNLQSTIMRQLLAKHMGLTFCNHQVKVPLT